MSVKFKYLKKEKEGEKEGIYFFEEQKEKEVLREGQKRWYGRQREKEALRLHLDGLI